MVPTIEMEIPSDNFKELPDVAAIVHELRLQISSLEKNFSGEESALKESLYTIEKTIINLNEKLEGMDPQMKAAEKIIQETTVKLDTLRDSIQE